MAKIMKSIEVEEVLVNTAERIFNELGLSLDQAVGLFLKQSELRGGIPFPIELPSTGKTADSEEHSDKLMEDILTELNDLK